MAKTKMITFNYNIPIEESMSVDNDFIIAGTAINATTTSNNHTFLPEVLEESAKTLIGVPLLVDHENKVENIKGRVFFAGYDSVEQKIPFKAKVMDNNIKAMIKDGRLNSVSVGASVDPKDVEEKDGCIIPRHITFKELSLVAIPADSGATFHIGMMEAYKKAKEEEPKEVEDEPELKDDDYVDLENNHSQVTDIQIERRLKMSEQAKVEEKIVETKAEVKEDTRIADMAAEIKSLKEKLEAKPKEVIKEVVKEVIKEVPAEVEESDSEYRIEQTSGTLRGGAFTLIRNKY